MGRTVVIIIFDYTISCVAFIHVVFYLIREETWTGTQCLDSFSGLNDVPHAVGGVAMLKNSRSHLRFLQASQEMMSLLGRFLIYFLY